MTIVNVACTQEKDNNKQLFGILLMTKPCYITSIKDDKPVIKRTVELKADILRVLF